MCLRPSARLALEMGMSVLHSKLDHAELSPGQRDDLRGYLLVALESGASEIAPSAASWIESEWQALASRAFLADLQLLAAAQPGSLASGLEASMQKMEAWLEAHPGAVD